MPFRIGSEPYLLVQQTFVMPSASPIRSIGDLDMPGRRLGATRADSIALYLRRSLKHAQLVELDEAGRDTVFRLLQERQIDDVRRSGFLQTSIERAGVAGIAMAGPR